MALQKIDTLALGRGAITDNTNAAIVFSANNLVDVWSNAVSYSQYNVVEYSGRIYRSKVNANLNLQPDTNPNSWETLYIGPKDGDAAFVISGSNSTVLQRVNSIWSPISGQPLTIALNDGQVAPATAFVFLGSTKAFGQVEYTLKRGGGHGRKRRGVFNVLNDTATSIDYDHEFNDIGIDVNVYLFWDMSGGNARLQYTSGTEGVAIQLKYILRGWT